MRGRAAVVMVLAALLVWGAVRSCGGDPPLDAEDRDEAMSSDVADGGRPVAESGPAKPRAAPPERRRIRVRDVAEEVPDPTAGRATETVSPPWLSLKLPRRTLDVVVVDENGAPRDDIDVCLVSTWLGESARAALRDDVDLMSRHLVSAARPGSDGRAQLAYVEAGDAALVAGDLDSPLAVLRRPGEHWPDTARFVVPREPGTLVVVVRRADGTPEPGATLRLERELPWEPSPWRNSLPIPQLTKSDARGIARLEGVGPGRARLFVSPAQGPPPDTRVVVDVADDGDTRAEVVLQPVRVLRGVVTSSATRRPLGGVWVEIVGSGAGLRANAAGRFEVPVRPGERGTVRARVVADGHAPAELLWRVAPDAAPIEVALDPLATIRLRCTDEEGAPVKDVTGLVETPLRVRLNLTWVELMHRHVAAATSNEDGLLEIAVPAAGDGRDGQHTVVLRRGGVHVTSVEVPGPAAGSSAGDFPVTVPAPEATGTTR